MLIDRILTQPITDKLADEPKVIVLYGSRQSGKTVLLNQIVARERRRVLFLKGDDVRVQDIFSLPDYDRLKNFIGQAQVLVIDEAQEIENVGASLKLFFDTSPIHILVSGSASFDLANKLAEPMTGRATFFTLYPLAVAELPLEELRFGLDKKLPELLVFGMYPKIHTLSAHREKEEYLYDVVNTYLYKDLLAFNEIKKPRKILDLLTLLALQIGSEVNVRELSAHLSLDRQTAEKYLDILEKMFVIVNLRGFSRNLRKEISKTSKYYFTDLGLRNGLIRNFNPVGLRADLGAMFENFAVLERIKVLANRRQEANFYFWRTYDQKEIDLIEEKRGRLSAFEFKWQERRPAPAVRREFMQNYPNSEFRQVTPGRLGDFLAGAV